MSFTNPDSVLTMAPRPVTSLHQIETVGRCSLRCSYCPSPKMGTPGWRPKMDMSEENFARCLDWLSYFCGRGTQGEVNPVGIGEGTMLESFPDQLARIRAVIGKGRRIIFATNGLHMTEELALALKPSAPRIWVSLHRPEKAGLAIEILKRHDLLDGISADPSINASTWAGQVTWFDSNTEEARRPTCEWLQHGMVMACSDGSVSACCFDATGVGRVASLADDPATVTTRPSKLCLTCNHRIVV